jgi:hypothetical protein
VLVVVEGTVVVGLWAAVEVELEAVVVLVEPFTVVLVEPFTVVLVAGSVGPTTVLEVATVPVGSVVVVLASATDVS